MYVIKRKAKECTFGSLMHESFSSKHRSSYYAGNQKH